LNLEEERQKKLDPDYVDVQEWLIEQESALNKKYQIIGCKKIDTKDDVTKIYTKKIQVHNVCMNECICIYACIFINM
jgi:hypothetical protein